MAEIVENFLSGKNWVKIVPLGRLIQYNFPTDIFSIKLALCLTELIMLNNNKINLVNGGAVSIMFSDTENEISEASLNSGHVLMPLGKA